MTYASSVSYLYGLQKHGIKLGLETMTALLDRLGMPQTRYRSLHIAGTNGKGSTAAMTASILQAAGYRVGLYTSPHLIEFRERIRVDGEMISEPEVARLTEQFRGICEPDLSPTFFEYTTVMAFQHFADKHADVAVLEVGMGGRFDATNVVTPVACAITTIGLDHEEYLGSTLASIAYEKAGIIKPQVPVVVGRISDEARLIIEAVGLDRAAPLSLLDRDFRVRAHDADRFSFSGAVLRCDDLCTPLQGLHQLDNAACALGLIEAAGLKGFRISEQAIRDGLRNVRWEGRMELVEGVPSLLLDGAHNPPAAAALAQYLRTFRMAHPESRVILVLGMMRDKDHGGFILPLKDLVDYVIFAQADLPRAATAQELQSELRYACPHSYAYTELSDALGKARELAGTNDLICVTGSLMLIGDTKALLHGGRLSPLRG
ncbi:bifunctional folylpolyglutamate synthase/dihydrofolate synthase [Petrachloros mirabilis]